jgi:hypothetical protein
MNVTNFYLFISQILSSQNITTNETTYYLQKNGSILYSPTQGLKVLNIASHLQKIPFLEATDILPKEGIQMDYKSAYEIKSYLLEMDFIKKFIEYHQEMKDLIQMHQSRLLLKNYIKIWSNGKITDDKNEIIYEACFPKNTFNFSYVEDYETFAYVDKEKMNIFVEKRNEIVEYLKELDIKRIGYKKNWI